MAQSVKTLYTVKDDGRVQLDLHAGQTKVWRSTRRFVFMLAGTQSGKALAVDTPIPTANGFVAMGDIKVGDVLFDESGQPCRVTRVTGIQYNRPCFRVTFDDGASLVTDAEHNWLTQAHNQRKNLARRVAQPDPRWSTRFQCQPGEDWTVRTTAEIQATLRHRIGKQVRRNHSIAVVAPVAYPRRDLPIPPYTLGVWLGDGYTDSPVIVTEDPEIVAEIRREGVSVEPVPWDTNSGNAIGYRLGHASGRGSRKPFTQRLNELCVRGNKHIPEIYLTAAREDRFRLLQGLMDTGGYAGVTGTCELALAHEPLVRDAVELMRSLGIKARVKSSPVRGKTGARHPRWRITFTTAAVEVFRLPRKRVRQALAQGRPDGNARFVDAVVPVPSVPVKCIEVDSPRHLYCAGRDYVVTHNTSFGPWWLWREIQLRGPGDYLAVTSTFDLFGLKMLPEMQTVFERVLGVGRLYPGAGIIEIANPETRKFEARRSADPMWARIIMRSASAEGGLESATAKAAWLDEVGQEGFSLQAWEAVLRRLSLHQGRVLGTTTLYTDGWLRKEVYDRWRAHDKDFDVIQYASTLNPSFPVAEYERAQRTLPLWKFNMFYRGEFTRPPGQIYADFDERFHKIPRRPLPGHWPRYVGIDPGKINMATVWICEDPTTHVYYVYRCTHEGDKTTKEHVATHLAHATGENVVLWTGGAGGEGQVRMDWNAEGIPVQQPEVGDVEAGIDRVISLLKQKRLFVFDDLDGLLDELTRYARELDDFGEPTDKIKDKERFHRLDALRYAVSYLEVSVTFADLGEPERVADRWSFMR